MNRKVMVSLVLGVTVSAGALYLAFRNVPFEDLLAYTGSINYLFVLPAVAVSLFTFVLRALRWQVILSSARNIGFCSAFHPMMIGFMINCILPGRAGEVARPVILKKSENVPFTTGIATVAAERAFDVAFLLIFFVAVLATVDIDPRASGEYNLSRETLVDISRGLLWICLLLIGGIAIVSIGKTRELIKRMISSLPSLFFLAGPRLRDVLTRASALFVSLLESFAAGLSLVKSPQKMILCLGLSFFVWVLSAFSYFVMSLGCPGIGLSFIEIAAVMIIICFAISLPSVPGWWGIWEAGGIFALSLFGTSGKEAAGYTLVNHAVQVFPVIIVGVVSAVRTGMNIVQVAYKERTDEM